MTSGLTRTSDRPSLPHSLEPYRASNRRSWKTPPREHRPMRRLLPSKRLRPLNKRLLRLSHPVQPVLLWPLLTERLPTENQLHMRLTPRSQCTTRDKNHQNHQDHLSQNPTESTTKDRLRPVRKVLAKVLARVLATPSASVGVVVSAKMARLRASLPMARPAQAMSRLRVALRAKVAKVVRKGPAVAIAKRRRSRTLRSRTALRVRRATSDTLSP